MAKKKISDPSHAQYSAYKQLVDDGAPAADVEKLHAFGLPPGTIIGLLGGVFTKFGGPQLVGALIPKLVELISGIGTKPTQKPPAPPAATTKKKKS